MSALMRVSVTESSLAGFPGRSILRSIRLIGLTFALVLAVAGSAVAAKTTKKPIAAPQNNIRSFYDTLLATMKAGPTLGQNGRFKRIAPALHQLFDLPYMTRLAVGSSWGSMTPEQQKGVTEAFGRYLSAVYADRFDSYSGEKFEVVGERTYGTNVIVDSRIIKSDGEPVAINYLMRKESGAWRVADIYLEGTISQMATQRSEFYSILREKGVQGLITALNHKADHLLDGSFSAPT